MHKTRGVISLLLLTSVGTSHSAEVTRVQYLMGALCEIRVTGEPEPNVIQSITEAFGEISRLEEILSTYRPASEVSSLNRLSPQKSHKCSPDLFALLQQAITYSEVTDGAFDVTLKKLGHRQIELKENDQTVVFKAAGLSIDFGGIGKGYALDKAAEILKRRNITQAEFNFSGQVLLINKPNETTPVLIADPSDPKKNVLTLNISNGSVSTSSQLERKNHIIDPWTGQPVDFQGSVTVISPTATQADALSTALLVLGPEKGIKIMEKEFRDSAALFLIPSKQGWTQVATLNFLSKYKGGK